MRRKKRKWWLLPVFLLSLAAFVYCFIFFNPQTPIKLYGINYSLPALPIFFLSFFLWIASLFGFLLNNLRRGFFIGLFAFSLLLLRYFGLKQILFMLLLVAIFASLELFFNSKNKQ